MSKPIVYVAGPMSQLSWEAMNGWRERIRLALPECEIRSPTRGKAWIKREATHLTSQAYDRPFGSSKAITRRDHWDVINSHLILVNAYGRPGGGVGRFTIIEMAWGWDHQIPIILIAAKDDDLRQHVAVQEFALEIVETEGAAISLTRALLNLNAGLHNHGSCCQEPLS